jgi:hypothetical protein
MLRPLLSPAPAFFSPSLLTGQFWKPLNIPAGQQWGVRDVLRIDGRDDANVLVARFQFTPRTKQYTQLSGQISVEIGQIFTRETTTRCHLTKQANGTFTISGERQQPTPQWRSFTSETQPRWILWISDRLRELGPNYVARPYTDGSFSTAASISGYFRMTGENTADW